MKKAVVFAMGVGVADQDLDDRRIKELQQLGGGSCAGAAHQIEAGFERRAAFAGIFAFGEDAEGLAKIFLMETANLTFAVDGAVVTLDQQIGAACDGADFDRSNIQGRAWTPGA